MQHSQCILIYAQKQPGACTAHISCCRRHHMLMVPAAAPFHPSPCLLKPHSPWATLSPITERSRALHSHPSEMQGSSDGRPLGNTYRPGEALLESGLWWHPPYSAPLSPVCPFPDTRPTHTCAGSQISPSLLPAVCAPCQPLPSFICRSSNIEVTISGKGAFRW